MTRLRLVRSIKGVITLTVLTLCVVPATASAANLTIPRARLASVTAMRHAWGDGARIYPEGCHRSNAMRVDCVVGATWPNADKDKDDSSGAVRVWVTLSHGVLIVHPAWDGREEELDVD
jgi:hypothetical protein